MKGEEAFFEIHSIPTKMSVTIEDWVARLDRTNSLHERYLKTVADAYKNYKEIEKIVEDMKRLNAPAETQAEAHAAFDRNKHHLQHCMQLLEEVSHLKRFTEEMVALKASEN